MRRVDVFFYGLFMDEELLRSKGFRPESPEQAVVEGLSLRIGQRAALVPSPGGHVHGVVFSLTRAEVDALYAEPSVQAYEPQAVLARLTSGEIIAALCYNLTEPPPPTDHNPDYARKLRAVAQRIGLPADYIASIE